MRRIAALSVGVSLLALACTADIKGTSDKPGTGPGGSTPGVTGPGTGPGSTPAAGALAGPSLRLLTEPQYRATLRSLFTFADELTLELEDDVALNGLRAIGTSNIALSPKATESYQKAAEVVAERGFGTDAAAAMTAGCDIAQATCASSYLADLGRRAFRRSLSDEEKTRFGGIYQAGVSKLASGGAGLKYAVTAMLSSPHFIYRVEIGQPTPGGPSARALTDFEVASKLAYFLWNGPPDKQLLDLAESGGLKASGALAAQATRLLAASGINAGLEGLFDDYLGLPDLPGVQKLPGRFPKFTPTLPEAMRTETLMDLSRAALGTADFRGIFNSSKTFVNGELASLYGVPGVSGAEFVEVDLPAASGRRGLLGNASILSLYAHASVSSPTLRGKFIRQILMCQAIPAPPPDVDTTLPDESEAKTARERLTIHSTNASCASCHQLMDPIGLALENFDAIGEYRTQDNGVTIDASGELDGVKFSGAAGLSDALAQNSGVPGCLARNIFRYAWGRLETQGDEALIADLTTAFQGSAYQMQKLISSAITAPGFVNVGEARPMKSLDMIKSSLKRRAFLRGALLGTPVALGLPLLEHFLNGNGDAFADGTDLPRRFGIFFWGNGRGIQADRWNPAATGTTWELSPQLQPLSAYKPYLNVVSGTKVKITESPQGHHRGSVGILSGNDFVTQPAGNAPYRSTFKDPSIDQTIAAVTGMQTAFKSLELGISSRLDKVEGTTLQFLSHNGPDSGNPQEYDPVKLFDRIFAGGPAPTTQDPELIKKVTEMKQSVLDSVLADLNGLQQRVGARDRLRLQQHADNIRAIEKRLGGGSTPLSAACADPMAPGKLAENPAGEPFVERMAAMSQVLALALACDLTRVFSIQFTGSAANPVLHPVGATRGNHDITHTGEAGQDLVDKSTIFTMEQLGVLLGALMAGVEGDSNLLQQSAILVTSDTSDGSAHSVDDYPIIVAGSAGGFFKNPGVHQRAMGENSSQVLLSLVQSQGLTLTQYGGGGGLVTTGCTAIQA